MPSARLNYLTGAALIALFVGFLALLISAS